MNFRPIAGTERKLETPTRPGKQAKPNALRNAQVLPPHNVDLTLEPTTVAQVRAFPTRQGIRFNQNVGIRGHRLSKP